MSVAPPQVWLVRFPVLSQAKAWSALLAASGPINYPRPILFATVLLDPLALTVFDEAHSQDEERWFTLGRSRHGTLLAVAHTWHVTGPNTARVRIISARPATRRERDQYAHHPR